MMLTNQKKKKRPKKTCYKYTPFPTAISSILDGLLMILRAICSYLLQ